MKKLPASIIAVLIIIVSSIAFFEGCKKTSSINNNPPVPASDTAGSVSGVVTDLTNTPIANATVTEGAFSTTTNAEGKFTMDSSKFAKDTAFLTVTKDGFFSGLRIFAVNNKIVNSLTILLVPKTVSGSFATNSGGSVAITGGGSLNFNASGVISGSTGAPYSGNVSVSTYYLDPSDPNFKNYMPGNLRGINASNKTTFLQPVAMASVVLSDGSGAMLQLAKGTTASLILPIPTGKQSIAPSIIPLWYFDEVSGVWKQQGIAARNGTNYVATVTHFTTWGIAGDSLFTAADSSFINLTLFGTNYYWAPPTPISGVFLTDSTHATDLSAGNANGSGDSATYVLLGIYNNNPVPGNYPFTLYTIINGSLTYNTYYPNNNPNAVITQYDSVGGYIAGSASGWIKNSPSAGTDSFPFTCTYKVIRTQ